MFHSATHKRHVDTISIAQTSNSNRSKVLNSSKVLNYSSANFNIITGVQTFMPEKSDRLVSNLKTIQEKEKKEDKSR